MGIEKGMEFDCIFEEALEFIDIKYTHLNKTIRYEKRPHGKWVEIEGEYETYCGCSNCKWENEHWQKQWVACPNCGATMDEGSDGNEKSRK